MFDEFGGLYYSYVDNKKEQVLIKKKQDHLIEQVSFEHFMKIQWQNSAGRLG